MCRIYVNNVNSEVNSCKTSCVVRFHYPNPDPMSTGPMKPRLAHGLRPALLPEARSSSVAVIIHLTLISLSDWLASTVPLPLRHCDHLFLSVSLHTTRHEYYQLNPQLVAHLSLRRFKHCLPFHFELPGPTVQISTAATHCVCHLSSHLPSNPRR